MGTTTYPILTGRCDDQPTVEDERTCAYPGDQEHDHAMCQDVMAEDEHQVPLDEANVPKPERLRNRAQRRAAERPARRTDHSKAIHRRRAKNRVARQTRRTNRRAA